MGDVVSSDMYSLHNKRPAPGRARYDFAMHAFASSWIQPEWPAPLGVRAIMTTRQGGVSSSPWNSMNLGTHVGDTPEHVQLNRERLASQTGKTHVFMDQVHGTRVEQLRTNTVHTLQADACWTSCPEVACTIMVADCLPVLLCDASGQWVGAAHAGWRGLAGVKGQGVLESLLSELPVDGQCGELMAWLGPCIGPQAFEVGQEVRSEFEDGALEVGLYFEPLPNGKYMADLAGLARQRLQHLGIRQIYGNDSQSAWCTSTHSDRFFSHRRDSRLLGKSGRMAACICLER
jgi:YfiH family protein